MSYVPPNPDRMVIGNDGRPRYFYGDAVRRELWRVQQAYGRAPAEPEAPQVWAAMPMETRAFFCSQALGARGERVAAMAWAEIESKDRAAIGAKARRLLGVLV